MEKIYIIGAGAIGSLVGSHLIGKFGKDNVILVDNDEEQVKAIRDNGLHFWDHSKNQNRFQKVEANIVTPDEIKKENLESVILSTKSYSNDESLNGLDPNVNMLVLQNGYDKRIEGFNNVVRGIEFGFACEVANPGLAINFVKGGYVLGSSGKKVHKGVRGWAELLDDAGIENKTTDSLNGYLWSKVLINSALNPLSAVRGSSFGELMNDKNSRKLFTQLYTEAYPLAKRHVEEFGEKLGSFEGSPALANFAFKIPIVSDMILIHKLAKKYKNVRSSMLQDIEKGRQTEIDFINGQIIGLGEKYGVKTPFNKEIYGAVKRLESSGLNSGADLK